MDRLTSQFREITATRNCPAVHSLLLDVWEFAQQRGEDEGLLQLAAVRHAIEASAAESERLRGLGVGWPGHVPTPAGPVLGAKALPGGKGWWGLLEGGLIVPGSDGRAKEAAYWCQDSSGWWQVPQRRAVAVAKAVAQNEGLFDDLEEAA